MSRRQHLITAAVGGAMGMVVSIICQSIGSPLWECIGMSFICGVAIGLHAERV